jgi:hypothetical protein
MTSTNYSERQSCEQCADLIAENNELRSLVEEAYLEGYSDGYEAGVRHYDDTEAWAQSLAKQSLEG